VSGIPAGLAAGNTGLAPTVNNSSQEKQKALQMQRFSLVYRL
jgi:hypothetical protein